VFQYSESSLAQLTRHKAVAPAQHCRASPVTGRPSLENGSRKRTPRQAVDESPFHRAGPSPHPLFYST
jgi:hypothetical protein